MAERSVLAHLEKLAADGLVSQLADESWVGLAVDLRG
jgi:predicted DNA-binding transcriptional regulator